jgi:UDP-N-acetylmuramoylalanine--D-glutamate ligase
MRIPDKIASAKKIHVLGVAGQEGRAVFDYLLSAGTDVVGHVSVPENGFKETFLSFSDAYEDEEARDMAERFSASGKMVFGESYAKGIEEGDAVIVPQAYRRFSLNNPVIEMDKEGKITLIQAIELAFSIAECKIVGATGTAGKSTVSAMIGNILKAAHVPFYFSGNDRENKWDFFALERLPESGFALFEISHRHLMDLKQSPNVAVITNIFPHHLDDAGSYQNYIEIKKNIYRFQGAGDVAIINRSLVESGIIKESVEMGGELVLYGGGTLEASYKGSEAKVVLSDFNLSGEHNIQNANAAMLAGLACGLPASAVEEGIKTFRGLKYRQEFIGGFGGVRVINDGKSTDPLATIEAVKSVKNIGALILGGVREGFSEGDFIPLGEAIAGAGIKNVFIFGSSKSDMAEDLSKTGVQSKLCGSLDNAVMEAKNAARSGEAIVFSPGCQSFDEFKDYRHRASAFNVAVGKAFG